MFGRVKNLNDGQKEIFHPEDNVSDTPLGVKFFLDERTG